MMATSQKEKPQHTKYTTRKLGGSLSKNIKSASLLRVNPETKDDELVLDLATGRSFFLLPWIKPPTATTARDGLGPLFNARNCSKCHQGGGRGRPPKADEEMRHMLVRVSISGRNKKKGVIPHPVYGSQLQIFGVERGTNGIQAAAGEGKKRVIGEAQIRVEYKIIKGTYPDGETYALSKPVFSFQDLSYGALGPEILTSPRVGPSLVGVGLIGKIPEEDILGLADPEDKNKDGVSGRANFVWSHEKNKTMLGRYGLKANTPTLAQQVADAFVNDIGITSRIFPNENCGEHQTTCLKGPNGRGPSSEFEIDDALLQSVTNFMRYFPVPFVKSKKIKNVEKGKNLFKKSGCESCHHPSFTTQKSSIPLLNQQSISPYSDFLLHDMGPLLADGRPDFEATGSEWRTAPLWGIGWRQNQGEFNNYLHDGRAHTVEEAVLWHSGEAEKAKQMYMHLKKSERNALLTFVESL